MSQAIVKYQPRVGDRVINTYQHKIAERGTGVVFLVDIYGVGVKFPRPGGDPEYVLSFFPHNHHLEVVA